MKRRLAAALLAVPLAFATLAGCSGGSADSGWPDSIVNNFMKSCEDSSGGQTAYCECSLDKLQAEYTLDEFEELEKRVIEDPDAAEELSGIIAACAAEVK